MPTTRTRARVQGLQQSSDAEPAADFSQHSDLMHGEELHDDDAQDGEQGEEGDEVAADEGKRIAHCLGSSIDLMPNLPPI